MEDRVLVIGYGETSLEVCRALSEKDLTVEYGNTGSFSPASYSRSVEQTYNFSTENGIEPLKDAVKEKNYDLLIPVNGDLVPEIIKGRESLENFTSIFIPEKESYRYLRNKSLTPKLCDRTDVPTPKTEKYMISELDEEKLPEKTPFYVKHIHSERGEDVDKIENRAEWREKIKEHRENYPDSTEFIIQDFVPGVTVSVNLVSDKGDVEALFQEKHVRELQSGLCSLRRTEEIANKLREYSERLIDELDYSGVAHLQFQRSSEDKFKLIEINHGFWSPVSAATKPEKNLPYLIYLLDAGEENIPSFSAKKEFYSGSFLANSAWFVERIRNREIDFSGIFSFLLGDSWRMLRGRESIDEFRINDPVPAIYTGVYMLKEFLR